MSSLSASSSACEKGNRLSPDIAVLDIDTLATAIAERLRIEADRLIDLRELAARLQLSERGVTGLVARNELPNGYLIGGVRRWCWADVLRYLDARRDRHPRRQRRGQYTRCQAAPPQPAQRDGRPREAGRSL